jgi:hypothetical protein
MMALDKMDNDAFLSYVLGHSKTPRHAFHINDVKRLMELAGVDEILIDDCGLFNFRGVGEHEGEKLVKLARARLTDRSATKASETT